MQHMQQAVAHIPQSFLVTTNLHLGRAIGPAKYFHRRDASLFCYGNQEILQIKVKLSAESSAKHLFKTCRYSNSKL